MPRARFARGEVNRTSHQHTPECGIVELVWEHIPLLRHRSPDARHRGVFTFDNNGRAIFVLAVFDN